MPPHAVKAQNAESVGPAKVSEHGFGEFEVPKMPRYIQSYTKRGNGFDGETQPVYQESRWGNPRYKGGVDAYVSELEGAPHYFDALKQKRGDQGVYEIKRWTPGYDWRGGFGIASLDAQKNYRQNTRGGMLRKGGPKRSDYIDRPNYWFEVARPGISHSRYTQKNNNYAGVYEWKRNTPFVSSDNDMLVLRDMIEHNPFHIASHAAAQAKQVYDKEFQPATEDRGVAAYNDNLPIEENTARVPGFRKIFDEDPYIDQSNIIKSTEPYVVDFMGPWQSK